MNERFFLKLLLALFSGLIAAELLVVVLFGLRLELILLCFIIAAALSGIVMVARLLLPERSDTESVSMRRARAMRDEGVRDRFLNYGVDEEFLGGKGAVRSKVAALSPDGSREPQRVSIEQAIREHAGMYGGLNELCQAMEKIDESSFERLMAKVGFAGVSRSEVMVKIRVMASEESVMSSATPLRSSLDSAINSFANDRESFDDYIRRSMTGGEDKSCRVEDSFSVDLDSDDLARPGTMPADFSHDPKAVFSKLRNTGRDE